MFHILESLGKEQGIRKIVQAWAQTVHCGMVLHPAREAGISASCLLNASNCSRNFWQKIKLYTQVFPNWFTLLSISPSFSVPMTKAFLVPVERNQGAICLTGYELNSSHALGCLCIILLSQDPSFHQRAGVGTCLPDIKGERWEFTPLPFCFNFSYILFTFFGGGVYTCVPLVYRWRLEKNFLQSSVLSTRWWIPGHQT